MEHGFAAQIRKLFPSAYNDYCWKYERATKPSGLVGEVVFTGVKYNGFDYNIASILGPENCERNSYHINYDAFRKAMEPIRVMATPFPAYPLTTVRFPYKMGCRCDSGDWSIVLQIIQEELVDQGIPVEIWKF